MVETRQRGSSKHVKREWMKGRDGRRRRSRKPYLFFAVKTRSRAAEVLGWTGVAASQAFTCEHTLPSLYLSLAGRDRRTYALGGCSKRGGGA